MHSIHPIQKESGDLPEPSNLAPDVTLQPSNAVEISPLEAGNKYLLAQARRKRKPGSSIRSGASGPQKFRSKHMVVVYYESYLQEKLESLVKSIGGARNELRKGKLARSVEQGLQLPSFGRHSENSYEIRSPADFKLSKKQTPLLPLNPKSFAAENVHKDDKPFTEADKELEQAQGLCETAAHQVLRDGDCVPEMNVVEKKLKVVLEIAKMAVKKFKEEKHQEEKGPGASDSDTTLVARTPPADHVVLKLEPTLNEISKVNQAMIASPTTDIEIDDNSDASSMVVDISKFRAARANGVRA